MPPHSPPSRVRRRFGRRVRACIRAGLLACGTGLLALSGAAAQERTLRWPAIDVEAHLDADGRLRVRERQTLLLSGDWNGPERRFSVPFGQSLTLVGFTRIDPRTGTESPMRVGALNDVDGYAWTDNATLRWRSRRANDPPHRADTLVYALDLLYEDVLQVEGNDRYRLAHDFAFADRREAIERFSLTLTLDPVWEAPPGFTGRFSAGPLPPGEGFVASVLLISAAGHQPASVMRGAPRTTRRALGAVLLLALVAALARLVAYERRVGRFAALPERRSISREWLEHHVFAFPPEVIGTAWDDRTAAPEVAATLARLIGDGKLSSDVKDESVWIFRRQALQLRLLVPRHTLDAHDLVLINALFTAGKDTTSTDEVRKRYKSTGFDPAALIAPSVRQRLDATLGLGGSVAAPSRVPALLLCAAGLALLVYGIVRQLPDIVALTGVAASLGAYLLLGIQAALWQRRVEHAAVHLLLRIALPLLAAGAALAWLVANGFPTVSASGLAGLVLFAGGLGLSATNIARARHDAIRIAARKRLAAARALFADELRTTTPALLDAWFPWILAFGLGREADRWFRAFGAATSASHLSSSAASGGGRSGGSSAGWSGFGGGGGFAGGGSSGSFAAAIGGMAASVAAPSSSGSGGGGGGGGGSSGGGGGGGW